uniref:AT-hook motif nuclear-localized protein n=2 Tax=Solanum lycopersicum TaxID=4081 RepID=K4BRL7_SOLLC
MLVESSRTRTLHVSLSSADNCVIDGYVFGMLMAATPVEVVVRFIPETEEPESMGYGDALNDSHLVDPPTTMMEMSHIYQW